MPNPTGRARVCVVTPGALGSNPRVVKEAATLTERGFETHVICTRTLAAVDERDADILAGARWRTQRIDLTGRAAWRVRRLCQSVAAGLSAVSGMEALADRAFSAFTPALTAEALRIPADLYIAHYPAALPAAASAARRHGGRFAFDAEDFHLGDLPSGPGSAGPNRRLRRIEARLLPDCAYVSAASPGIADAYADAYGIERPAVIMNLFPSAQGIDAPTSRGESPGPSVYWFSQVIGPDRGLESAIRAIGQAHSRPHLNLRGMISDAFRRKLQDIASSVGAADRLHILAPAPPSDMERLAAQYDVGLVAEPGHTVNRQIALTNKQFTYLLAGLPSLLSDIPAHRAIAHDLGDAACLFAADDANSLAATLDATLGDAGRLAQRRRIAFELGRSRFNWDVEQEVFLACVQRGLR